MHTVKAYGIHTPSLAMDILSGIRPSTIPIAQTHRQITVLSACYGSKLRAFHSGVTKSQHGKYDPYRDFCGREHLSMGQIHYDWGEHSGIGQCHSNW
jgi:hypothetical protein